jgi:hypothetical protein
MSPLPSQPLISNGPATYLHYLTGRRNLLSLHMALNLLPRHNFIQLIQDLVFSIIDPVSQSVEDEIVLDFTLGENGKGQLGEGPGVWAVVDKSGVLTSIRKQRWDVVGICSLLLSLYSTNSIISLCRRSPRPLNALRFPTPTWC